MSLNVLYVQPDFDTEGLPPVLVKQSYQSALLQARQLYEWHARKKGRQVTAADEEMLDDWMSVHWAWFDEDGQ